jgi:KUP system potassium uptake protein
MDETKARPRALTLAISAIGVVFGDIGTSPLYALRESFSPAHGLAVSPDNILGIVSLLIWSMSLIVSVKYLAFVLQADNKGEGGILALVSLASRHLRKGGGWTAGIVTTLGILGAALLYSDGLLTPAVSVLSAVEGLIVLNPRLSAFVVPIAIVVLVSLFPFQKRGTEKVGMVFGPVLSLWFLAIGLLGILAIVADPAILQALNPLFAVRFLLRNGLRSLGVMGSVFLAMTGAEVLYSDLGHFGKSPIRRSWFCFVYPALLLNYIGQGAFLLSHPGLSENLFYRLAPGWAIIPMVALATVATIIASQAVISGAFSLARQSVQLGFWPRVRVCHTSDEKIGQVYVPLVNVFLLAGTVSLVLLFRNSAKLAQAYGITVSATMLITTILMLYLMGKGGKAKLWLLIPGGALFLILDTGFFLANAMKFLSGGWLVVALATVIFLLMRTWVDGRSLLRKRLQGMSLEIGAFAAMIARDPPAKAQGTALFFTADPGAVPKALLHNLKHNRILHERTVVVSVQTTDEPYVEEEARLTVGELPGGIYQVGLRFGFSETPDVPKALERLELPGYDHNVLKTSYFLGREAIVIGRRRGGMARWRKRIFTFMFNNARRPADFFCLPAERVVELGSKNEL